MTIQPNFQSYQPVDADFKLEKNNKEPKLNGMLIWLNKDGSDVRDAKQQLERTVRNTVDTFWKLW